MFSKILVANRSEIAVRAFRAAYELGAKTVAVFPYEDRNSEHRLKADEAYLIGEEGHPVKAYLDIVEIIRVAKQAGADAIYPGYGFLSENPDLAKQCNENGITFIGPPSSVLEMAGNKVKAIQAAKAAGIPVLNSSAPSADPAQLIKAAPQIGFPLFCKAVAGGGGRGMRLVNTPAELPDALAVAMREAQGAFGDATMFLEQAVTRPRHIEVQILADGQGNVVHLFERDCSVQRRHQKVIEIAPAPGLSPEVRAKLCQDAVRFAQAIGYQNAGTVEFLLETAGPRKGQHVFIEMNPRIQVEHTVTEEITDIDLVASQIEIAAGKSLNDLGINQDNVHINGTALQCRITTEDPANDFRPDVGRIIGYRSPGGAGVRLDGSTATAGALVSGHFDSMLVKLTCRGRDFDAAVNRSRRALAEFRIRGVRTNIPFLKAVLSDPTFDGEYLSTTFIAERPQLFDVKESADRGTKLLQYIGEVTVNQPYQRPIERLDALEKLPALLQGEPIRGTRQQLLELGPENFAARLRSQKPLAVTDTTFRDAHQSLLATRVRTYDLAAVSKHVAQLTPQLLSLEAWGGATYDVALRFLKENPWERLERLRELIPNVALQMLLRGRNTVGYTPYPNEVTTAFVAEATRSGIDIFRIFDALNDVSQMRPAIDAVRETGHGLAEVALCYTGNLLDPKEDLYTLDYYLRTAEEIVAAGAHVLAIKDMAGLLRPQAAKLLVQHLRRNFDLPVHLHTHDTTGGQLATLLAASDAGVDAVDVACAAMSGSTSQPSLSALVAALANTERETELDLQAVCDLEPYWEATRKIYAPFESSLPAPSGRVSAHEIPGGQLSNLRQQAIALGIGNRFEEIETVYTRVDQILGRLIKVTPSSKVVGDLALNLVAQGTPLDDFEENPQNYDIPESVIGFLSGDLGTPVGGWPEPFRTKALQGRKHLTTITPLSSEAKEALATPGKVCQNQLNYLLFPGPNREYEAASRNYGDLSVLDTNSFLYGLKAGQEVAVQLSAGVRIIFGLEAVGEPDLKGFRTVMFTMNGQLRPIQVRDHSIDVDDTITEKADQQVPGHIAAPYAGAVTVLVQEGDKGDAGQTVATIEAMKMEAAITTPITGTVQRLATGAVQQLEGGNLIMVIGK